MYNSKYVKDFDLVIYHDSIETEIEADENAQGKMFQFILKFRTNSRFSINKSRVRAQLEKCIINEKAVMLDVLFKLNIMQMIGFLLWI